MRIKILLLSFTLVKSINALVNVILTPKENYKFMNSSFIFEHNLEYLAGIYDLNIYKTSIENYNNYKNIFNILFDIEEEQIYKINPNKNFCVNNNLYLFKKNIPWHLDRISKVNLPLDNSYPYSFSGSCHTNNSIQIDTYIVDTGVDVNHPEFENRVSFLENFTNDNKNYDANSHGTHCAGIVGAKTYGVCKDAKIFGVKVLDSRGSNSFSIYLLNLTIINKFLIIII